MKRKKKSDEYIKNFETHMGDIMIILSKIGLNIA